MTRILEFPTLRPGYDDNLPACDEGLTLAHGFIDSCINALESGSSSNFNARFESYMRHRAECPKCNEI
jgi:hypothetical protein